VPEADGAVEVLLHEKAAMQHKAATITFIQTLEFSLIKFISLFLIFLVLAGCI
jgi:hypothetical protein